MLRQLAEAGTCSEALAWVQTAGGNVCDPLELPEAFPTFEEGEEVLVLDNDHVHPRSATSEDARVVVLYGAVGSKSFAEAYRYLVSVMESDKVDPFPWYYEAQHR